MLYPTTVIVCAILSMMGSLVGLFTAASPQTCEKWGCPTTLKQLRSYRWRGHVWWLQCYHVYDVTKAKMSLTKTSFCGAWLRSVSFCLLRRSCGPSFRTIRTHSLTSASPGFLAHWLLQRFSQWAALLTSWKKIGRGNPGYISLSLLLWGVHLPSLSLIVDPVLACR